MTAGEESWWHAMLAEQFGDGSLVIQDDTLSVNGGSTVNLLVKLGAKPRSDVTVALSETSALISLGVASLVFTPQNWDTYQSVVVTGSGNRQEIDVPDTTYREAASSVTWSYENATRPAIIAGLRGAVIRYFFFVRAFRSASNRAGEVDLVFDDTATGTSPASNQDLSDAFETSGEIVLTVGTNTITVALAGADTTEPYSWTPANSTDVSAFADAVAALTGNQPLNLVLRDYASADATISLSASGPAEYAGKTGSATVTVN